MIRLPRHEWRKSWSNNEDPVVLFERNVYGHPLAGFLWERPFEEVLMGLGLVKVTELGMLVCSSKTKIILIGMSGWHQHGWKEAEYGSCVEEIDEEFSSWWTNIISFWPRVLGIERDHQPIHRNVWITQFCWSNWKNCRMVLRRGRTCSKGALRGIANWQVKKTEQVYKVSTPCLDDHNFKNENWKQLENCQMSAPRLSRSACVWHRLVDQFFLS